MPKEQKWEEAIDELPSFSNDELDQVIVLRSYLKELISEVLLSQKKEILNELRERVEGMKKNKFKASESGPTTMMLTHEYNSALDQVLEILK